MRKQLSKITFGLLSFVIPFLLYSITLHRGVAAGDSTEMVTAAYTLGIAHQPGYPLNNLIGFIFKNIPLPVEEVMRINLASASLQALGVMLFFFLMLHLISQKKGEKLSLPDYLASFSSALVMGFSLIYWEYATKFEVFSLNNVFSILILILSLRIANYFKTDKKIDKRQILVYGFVWGLAFSHHQTVVLIAPASLILLWDIAKDVYEKKLLYKEDFLRLLISFILGVLVFFVLILGISSKAPLLDNSGISGIRSAFEALLRSEYGTFTASLTQGTSVINTSPYDQVEYYLKNSISDYSLFAFAFVFLGLINLFRNSKRFLTFSLAGILIAGFLFLVVAGFDVISPFGQATVRRFFMLPNIFMAILIGFGLEYVLSWLSGIKRKSGYAVGINLAYLYLTLIFAFPIYVNFAKADNSENNLVEYYVDKTYSPIDKDAIFMYSGDFTVMTADYFRFIIKKEPERIFFTPGRFFSDWYIPRLLEKYPDLDIPVPQAGSRFTSTSQLAMANYEKHDIYINWELSSKDPLLEKDFTLYPRHFLIRVAKKGEDLKLEDWKKENEDLFNSLDMELLKEIERKQPTYEMELINYFARHFYNSGYVYDQVGLYEEAIVEYERTLTIYPGFREAYAALGLIYGEKLETPDYQAAMQYLLTYRSMLYPGEEEVFIEAEKKLSEYNEKLNELIKQEEEKMKQEEEVSEEEDEVEEDEVVNQE